MRRGFTYLEALLACGTLLVTFYGLMGMLSYCISGTSDSDILIIEGQIGRGEIERAKVWGWANLPTGTITSLSPPVGGWVGAYDATLNSGLGGWSLNATTYYDITGAQTTAASTTRAFSVTTTISDAGTNQVMDSVSATPAIGDAYALDIYATRHIVVTVSDLVSVRTIKYSTTLVKGGT